MHIIGIQIEEGCDDEVVKNLKPGWFPFGNYEDPRQQNAFFKWINKNVHSDRLYQLYPDMPQISVSCIVGKNGSGKTTLLDVLYRILNNFSCNLSPKWGEDSLDLAKAKGVNGKLYFEVEGNVGFIESKNEGESELYYRINADNCFNKIDYEDYPNILRELFYTIGVNYSIYSMSFEDYNGKDEYKNKWMEKIYRNIEGNYVPLSFTPDRLGGQIEVIAEQKNAERRIMTIATLLHSQKNELLSGYTPIRIEYSIDDAYEEEMESIISKYSIQRGLYNLIDPIMDKFKFCWQKKLYDGKPKKHISNKILSSLAYESTSLCFVYKSYGDTLQLAKIKKEYDDKDKIENEGKFEELIDRIMIEQKTTSVLQNIHQLLSYYTRNEQNESGKIDIEELCMQRLHTRNMPFSTYQEVYELLPPVFLKCSLVFKKDGTNDAVKLYNMSSGERQMLYSNSTVLYHIINIVNSVEDTRIIKYKHINIIYDEVELYAHPEFQRNFIFLLIKLLSNLHVDNNLIRSINLIIATHSPFIVSDVPKDNILTLEEGKRIELNEQTYCANIYDLMKNSFFLKYSMGEAARRRLDDVVQAYNNVDNKKDIIRNGATFYSYLKDCVADPYLRSSISLMVESILDENKQGLSKLLSQKKELEERIEELNIKIDNLNEENRV